MISVSGSQHTSPSLASYSRPEGAARLGLEMGGGYHDEQVAVKYNVCQNYAKLNSQNGSYSKRLDATMNNLL